MGICSRVGAGTCVFTSTSSETPLKPVTELSAQRCGGGRGGGGLTVSGPARKELESHYSCPENNTRAEQAENPQLF